MMTLSAMTQAEDFLLRRVDELEAALRPFAQLYSNVGNAELKQIADGSDELFIEDIPQWKAVMLLNARKALDR